jgi:hypothetical protein
MTPFPVIRAGRAPARGSARATGRAFGVDRRLGDVIEHEGLIWELAHELDRGGQLSWKYEQVLREAVLVELGNPALKPARREVRRGTSDAAPVPRAVRPFFPHDAANDRHAVRELERPARFLKALPRLDRNAAVKLRRSQRRRETRRQPVALERRASWNPGILRRVVTSEVLVRIEHASGKEAIGERCAVALRKATTFPRGRARSGG